MNEWHQSWRPASLIIAGVVILALIIAAPKPTYEAGQKRGLETGAAVFKVMLHAF